MIFYQKVNNLFSITNPRYIILLKMSNVINSSFMRFDIIKKLMI